MVLLHPDINKERPTAKSSCHKAKQHLSITLSTKKN